MRGLGLMVCGLLAAWPATPQSLEFGPPHVLAGSFTAPAGLGLDPALGRLLVADTADHRVRWAPLADLAAGPAWDEFGFVADRATDEALNEPQAVAVDGAGNAYVVDTHAGEVELYRWNPGVGYVRDPIFASATRNQVGGVDLRFPRDIAVGGPGGRIYLLDSGNSRILVADGPTDTSWEVWREDPGWRNPYGLDVATDGTVYLADTDNHRILRLAPGGGTQAFGTFGVGNLRFRFPRDVAVADDGRMFVADTYNHRIVVLRPDGSHYRNLGSAPLYATLQKIEVDAENRVFAVDSGREAVIAFLGPVADPPFDAYLRDFVGDPGSQPSDPGSVLSSPDLLVRHDPDVDLEAAAATGLEAYAFEQPRFDQNNYVYLAVRNRGRHPISGAIAKLYWADPGSPLAFPEDWSRDGFFERWIDATTLEIGNSLFVPTIPPRQGPPGAEVDGVAVVGPLIWRPPAPETPTAADGRTHLFARLVHLDDPSEDAPGLDGVRLNNNVGLRRTVVSRGPFPIGDQDTLVVRVRFAGIPGEADETVVRSRIDEVNDWLAEVTYGQTTLRPLFLGPLDLTHGPDHYQAAERNLLVEMAGEVLDTLLTAQPTLLDGPTPDPEDDVDRLVVVVNDPAFDTDWATTGLWPYDLAGEPRHLSVSVQGPGNSAAQYAHGLSHQFGLVDLYVHEEVAADPTLEQAASRWDNMARPFEAAHPLVWSKQHATWVTSHGGRILYIPRPRVSSPRLGEPPVPLSFQSILESDEIGAIAIGLTEGVTTFEEETHLYWVEVRRPGLASDTVPDEGAVVYYAHNLVPQGEAPVIVRDPSPGTSRDDAGLDVGQSIAPAGTGITVSVDSELPDDGGYLVRVDYEPPPEHYNVYMRKSHPVWHSPDIWVDNQENGYADYDGVAFVSSGPVNEPPIAGEENRIFARVHNSGPAPAFDVEVVFSLSEPYHTVGGEGDFDVRALRVIPHIPAGESREVYFVWEPDEDEEDPHNCARVTLRRLLDDTNPHDNEAQQNLTVRVSDRASPYRKVDFDFQVTNPEDDDSTLVYLRADGVPPAWTNAFAEPKRLLAGAERFEGLLSLQPHDAAPVCTNHEVEVTAWIPRGDTLVALGGTTVDVALRNRTELTLEAGVGSCQRRAGAVSHRDTPAFAPEGALALAPARRSKQCAVVDVAGCTQPPRPNERIVVRYRDPAGNPVYREVMTDAMGCFEDFHVVVEGGTWEATAVYPGDECSGPARLGIDVLVPLLVTGDQDADGVLDVDEVQGDADGDGVPNHLDVDSDGDGIGDADEPSGDADLDGQDNVVDLDSDNDGLLDADELAGDADLDGLDNLVDPDSDGDGLSDGAEAAGDADGDGLDNVVDPDSDDDGLPDGDEAVGDSDGDGLDDVVDPDSDDDGVLDGDEPAGDVDGDGLANVVDPDSDGDGMPDGVDPSPWGPAADEERRDFELFVGYLSLDTALPIESGPLVGLRVGRAVGAWWEIEGELAVAPTEDAAGASGRVWRLTANALRHWRPRSAPLVPYLRGGVGYVLYRGFPVEDEGPVIGLGAGVKVPLRPGFGLRGEVGVDHASGVYGAGAHTHLMVTVGLAIEF